MRDCPTCGTAVAEEARFCPECGHALADEAGMLDARFLPGSSRHRVGPAGALLLATLLLGAAVALVATGRWTWGLVLLAAAGLAGVAYGRLSGRGSLVAIAEVRERALVTSEAMAARSRQHVALFRERRELADRESERVRLFRELGEAAYGGDSAAAETARRALDDVHAAIAAKEAEIEALKREAGERVEGARATVRASERLEEDAAAPSTSGPAPSETPLEPETRERPPDEGSEPRS